MTKSIKNIKGEIGWAFAEINKRLGEVIFEQGKGVKGIFAHTFIDRKEFTKIEQIMIDQDIKKNKFIYRNKRYRACLHSATT